MALIAKTNLKQIILIAMGAKQKSWWIFLIADL
jgi:hypothetical protein